MSVRPKKMRKKSVVVNVFGAISKRIYRFIQNSLFGRFFSNYDVACRKLDNSFLAKLVTRNQNKSSKKYIAPIAESMPSEAEGIVSYDSQNIRKGLRDKFSEKFDNSKLVCCARECKTALLNTSMVTYGLLLFGFALFFLISRAMALFFAAFDVSLGGLSYALSDDIVLTVTYMATAVVLMALSLIWVFAQEGSLISFAVNSKLVGSLINASMGISKVEKPYNNGKIIPRKYAFLIGMLLGILTFFVTPYWFFIGLLVVLFTAFTVNAPEFGLVVLTVSLPYYSLLDHPTLITLFTTGLILVSTFLKLLRGKRTYRVELLDLFVGLFLILILFGGVITVGGASSFQAAVTMFFFGAIYFAARVLVRDIAWFKRCVNMFVFSSVPVAILAILEFVFGKASSIWQDTDVFSSLSGRAASLWGNPNVLAEFLLVTFFCSFGCLLARKRASAKISALVLTALNATALVFTWSRGAWLALAVALIVSLLVYSHKSVPFIFLGALALVAGFVFLPQTLIARVESIVTFSDSSTLYRIHIWQGCAALVRDTFWSGVGVGSDAFANAYRAYALPGIESAPHAHNLVMQILIELGIVGVAVFATMMLTVMRVVFTLFAKCRIKNEISLYALGISGALLALCIHGVTDYIWYNYRVFLIFFLLIGLLASARNIGAKLLMETNKEWDSCDVDLLISK